MAVMARMRLKQDDGTIIEETHQWREYEMAAEIYPSQHPAEAFHRFLDNMDYIVPINNLANLVAIKFYDSNKFKNSNWNGGWLYITPQ